MPKTAPKKTEIKKSNFDLEAFKNKNAPMPDNIDVDKPLQWIPLSEAFHDAVKLPGIPTGFFVSFRGYSNTGKSTAMYEAVVGAQKLGILPIIFETEGNWNWEHAKQIGVEFTPTNIDEETGKILKATGDFILITSPMLYEKYKCYDHQHSKMMTKPLRFEPVIEDVAAEMTYYLDAQQTGDLPRDVLFFWDSVGSMNCFKGATSKTSNNQWTAGAISSAFKPLIYYRIPASRKQHMPYTATFAIVQQIWLDNENQVIKHKGGEAFFSSPRLIFHYGGILTHGSEKLKAIANGAEYQFGTKVKIRCEKNHVNGIEQKGEIVSTPHGYWNPDKIDDYKKEYKDYILSQLNMEYGDFDTVKEVVTKVEE